MKKFWSATLLATTLTCATVATLPVAAQADYVGTDAAIGAAVGSIVGQLLFDSNRDQYYYVDHYRHWHYVDNDTARYYYREHGRSGWDRDRAYDRWHDEHGRSVWNRDRGYDRGYDRGENRSGHDWHDGDRHDRGDGHDHDQDWRH